MDSEVSDSPGAEQAETPGRGRLSRRRLVAYGTAAAAGVAGVSAALIYGIPRAVKGIKNLVIEAFETTAEVFRNDAPKGELWRAWQARGWAREARHYRKLGRNVQCGLCPNRCLLEPDDRGRCRNRVNKDGTLYTLVYGNPCAVHVDPIEKKPLLHFLPRSKSFSIATSGCGFRCLNCQNWEISQSKPEDVKKVDAEAFRLNPAYLRGGGRGQMAHMSMFPEDVVAMAEHAQCKTIAYTYSEPTMFFEYMTDTCRLAHAKGIRNVWVTCGYINPEPLAELCGVMDAANVDLKSFDDAIYKKLNSGKLQPILDCLTTLKARGVWFEVTNLVVPTYTDKSDMIARMCDWLVKHVGPDYPLHFSRFHPQHKLKKLPLTPVDTLIEARRIARAAGLRYVYIGNARGVPDSETTFCPKCGKIAVARSGFFVLAVNIADGKCRSCGTPVAGVWT